MNIRAKMKVSASKSATSPSREPLAVSLAERNRIQQTIFLTMEINKLSETELFELLETYKDRIETITEYIEDTDDAETRSNMKVQLHRYKMTLNTIKSEIEMRKTLKKIWDYKSRSN